VLSKLLLDAASRPPSRGSQEQADDRARQDELNVRGEATGAMPAAPAVKELAAVRPQADAAPSVVGLNGPGPRASSATPKRPLRISKYPITGQMQRRTEGEGGEPRACQRTRCGTRRDMERDDHE
jgi:hypothetical protein